MNTAFLLSLCPSDREDHKKALNILHTPQAGMEALLSFYNTAREVISKEEEANREVLNKWPPLRAASCHEAQKVIHEALFPEGNLLHQENYIEHLRGKRLVRIVRPNPQPVRDPCREVLFTANALLTVPEVLTEQHRRTLGPELTRMVDSAMTEEQVFWYDHPVEVGCPEEENEILYGLRGLSEALEFERTLQRLPSTSGLTVVLSASVTHRGLQRLVRDYLRHLLGENRPSGLEVFVFTEQDTEVLVDDVLGPAYWNFNGLDITGQLKEVFGVDGQYGRHYSFLKAIAPLWQLIMNPHLKATFKIDLDQVFPQEALLRETGLTALEHLCTPLWGAEGFDSDGEPVRLGLLAGALVNEKDISKGLFTPDVKLPQRPPLADEVVFHSQVPQAISTEAEMLCRYALGTRIDGHRTCIQRIHVTGGTTGVLVEDLLRYRPFSPTFIGRAEDQAYLMSVLYREPPPYLRYLHRSGLFMRHDKEAFARRAIKRAEAGKKIGDYLRIILFSLYAQSLPWSAEKTREALEPFTGAFIHNMPFTMACLRLALRAGYMFQKGKKEEAEEFLKMGSRRLLKVMDLYRENPSFVKDRFQTEQSAWDAYYSILQSLRAEIKKARTEAVKLLTRAREIINTCRV